MPCRVRTRLLALLVAALAVCAGCQVDARVTVSVERSGSGTVSVRVTLDPEAAEQVGDVATAFRFDDLRQAGWDVERPASSSLGLVLDATKRFATPGELQAVLDEVGGRDGVFRGWKVAVDDGFASTSYAVGGTLHLTGGLEQFSDADIATALDGLPLGRTPDEIAAALGPGPDAVQLTVRAVLPGGGSAEEHAALGDGKAQDRVMLAGSELSDGAPARWLILAAACLVVAALLVVVPRVRRR